MKVYRLHFTRGKFTVGIWTTDIRRALAFIEQHKDETIYVEIR